MIRRFTLALCLLAATPALAQQPPEPDPAITARVMEHEDELLAKLQAQSPERYEALIALRDTDKRAYTRGLVRVARFLRGGQGGRHESSPELVAERTELAALRARYPDGFDDLSRKDLAAVKAEATAIAERIFVLKQAERRERIDKLSAALDELNTEVAQRDGDRTKILDDFVETFLRGRVEL